MNFVGAGVDAPVGRFRGATTFVLAAVVASAIIISVEYHWRALGYVPNIRDSAELWSIQRDRVYSAKKIPLVLLGASRIEFAVDTKLLRQLLPGYQPVMLAQNAHYPLATLRDLAADERFHGVVLCDVESGALYKMFVDMQQPLVDYYHHQWSPSWHLHRLLLTLWQANAVAANPDLGSVAVALRWFGSTPPPSPEYMHFHADRSGDIDYSHVNVASVKRHFANALAGNTDTHALVAPDPWLADLAQVYQWTRDIQARGGKVIFYQSPTGPTLRQIESLRHPSAQYWDRFVAGSPAPAIDAASEPRLSAFPQPDDSHIDFRDKAGYTRALVDVLVERGLIQR